jgi:hypothetical protein
MSEERTSSEPSVDTYITEELAATRRSLRKTQLFGTIIVVVLSIYLIVVTVKFKSYLEPDPAAEIAAGFVVEQIEKYRGPFVAEVQQRVPAMIQQLPDYVLSQMPLARQRVEETFENELRKYCQSTSDRLGAELDKYLENNKDQIHAVLEVSEDPKAIERLGPSIRSQLIAAYLEEEPAEGTSVREQVAESFTMLQNAQQRLHRLATASDLTSEEKKARRAVAIITDTIDKEHLQPLPLPPRIPEPEPVGATTTTPEQRARMGERRQQAQETRGQAAETGRRGGGAPGAGG